MPKKITDEQIWEATIELLLERGYVGAATREIAERAGISEMTLFRRFGTKAKLAASAMAYLIRRHGPEVVYTGDVVADLLGLVRYYHEKGKERRTRLLPLMLLEVARHEELREALEVPFAVLASVGGLLARYQEEGVLRREPPLQAVASLIGPLLMLRMMRDAAPDAALDTIELEVMVEAYLTGRRQG